MEEEEKPIGYIALIDGAPITTGSSYSRRSRKLYTKAGVARSVAKRQVPRGSNAEVKVFAVCLSKCEEV